MHSMLVVRCLLPLTVKRGHHGIVLTSDRSKRCAGIGALSWRNANLLLMSHVVISKPALQCTYSHGRRKRGRIGLICVEAGGKTRTLG